MSAREEDERIIVLNEIDENPISTAISTLFSLAQKDKKPIYIIINTWGGSVYDMLAIYDAIKYIQSLGVQVDTIGLGKIMSAGLIILLAGDNRKIGRNATIMWHWPYDESLGGDILQVKNDLDELTRVSELCNNIIVENTKMKKGDVENLLKARLDVYLTPEQAIEYGIVNGYLDSAPAPAVKKPAKKTTKRTTKK